MEQFTFTTTNIAKQYGMTAGRLNKILKELNVQRKYSGEWQLTPEHQGYGYVNSRSFTYTDADGYTHMRFHTVWTERGKEFIFNVLRQNGIVPLV